MRSSLRWPALVALSVLSGSVTGAGTPSQSPGRAADELLATDRKYAAVATHLNVVDALSSMFSQDVVLSALGAFSFGRDAALGQLRSVPEYATARLEWAPVRVGISADGLHGFTYGFMTLVRADSTRLPLKYLAYWIRGGDGWKVAVYRRAGRAPGDVSLAMRDPLLPAKLVAPNADPGAVARYAKEVADAERAFSDLAAKIGLGPAFTHNAAPDAMNMGGQQRTDFVYGPEAIGVAVGGGQNGPSTLTWGADTVLVASSGDLGVTIGHIVAPDAAGGAPKRIPFFTVWKKVGAVWKFVAE